MHSPPSTDVHPHHHPAVARNTIDRPGHGHYRRDQDPPRRRAPDPYPGPALRTNPRPRPLPTGASCRPRSSDPKRTSC
ncbi:hypothetical protein EHYA_05839 [Embleya hyalina]|uniref:Uncharacterized protein n=1 Tax=Embleya hyalina TaxID=516124 RepID=A0A401YU97_9ACTN|nr:hypothetical protein EHYA_05839 [Embleya hyalina]